MRRKDGKPKLQARRTLPEYDYGFGSNPGTASYRHPCCSGTRTPDHWKVLSLFSGCGGLDLSFLGGFRVFGQVHEALPFDIVAAVDFSEDAVGCYRLNLGTHVRCADLMETPAADLPKADVLIGGFPCQDFSSSGPKTGFAGSRGKLYRVLVDYMAAHRPKVVVAENVPYLARLCEGEYLATIIREFEETGYHFDVWELYGPDYGLPQSRRRLFLVGVRDDLPGYPCLPGPTHLGRHRTISEALLDLEEIDDERVANQSQFFVSSRATSGGGQGDHRNQPDKVAYCIRANARGRIQFHHRFDRRLTVRECARLQSFPDEFVFPYSTQRNLTLIGNAVPPILGYRVAQAVADYLGAVQSRGSAPGDAKAAGESLARRRSYRIQQNLFGL